jgi:hypothetical protein
MDVVLKYVETTTTFHAARILALLHDTTEIGVVDNVCAIVQWYEDAPLAACRNECRLVADAQAWPSLRMVVPTTVSVQPITEIVTVTHIFETASDSALGIRASSSDDSRVVFVRDCAYEQLYVQPPQMVHEELN